MTKFIKGNWYQKGKVNGYFKFSHIVKELGYNEIWYTEVYHSDCGHFFKDDFIANNSMELYALNNPVSYEQIMKMDPSYAINGHYEIF